MNWGQCFNTAKCWLLFSRGKEEREMAMLLVVIKNDKIEQNTAVSNFDCANDVEKKFEYFCNNKQNFVYMKSL